MNMNGLTLVGKYRGRGGISLSVFKGKGKYYLEQNPNASSIFARARREGHDVKWELNKYPINYKTLSYTGTLIMDGRFMPRREGRDALIAEQLNQTM